MKFEEFCGSLKRLTDRFGDRIYTESFTKLLWKEISWLPPKAFDWMIDRAIGEMRQAPLMPEFREMISRYRENLAAGQKKESVKSFAEARSSLTDTDEKLLFDLIKRMLATNNSKERNQMGKDVMKYLNQKSPPKCFKCDDSGLVYNFDDKPMSYCDCGA